MRTVDLRSDTTTLPTDAMRQAIAGSELGDDVFQGDPTVNRLQDLAGLGRETWLQDLLKLSPERRWNCRGVLRTPTRPFISMA